jgi:plasmid stabilization system protein ParE
MAKGVVWTEQAKADIRGIERPIALQILKTLARYAQPGEGNTKQLRA